MSTHYRVTIHRFEGDDDWHARVIREHHTSDTESVAWEESDKDITALSARAMEFMRTREGEKFDGDVCACVECGAQLPSDS